MFLFSEGSTTQTMLRQDNTCKQKTPAKRRLCVDKMVNICHTGG